jgi:hypothetical protein
MLQQHSKEPSKEPTRSAFSSRQLLNFYNSRSAQLLNDNHAIAYD